MWVSNKNCPYQHNYLKRFYSISPIIPQALINNIQIPDRRNQIQFTFQHSVQRIKREYTDTQRNETHFKKV